MNFEQWFTREYPGENHLTKKIAAAAWEEAIRQAKPSLAPTYETLDVLRKIRKGQFWNINVKGGVHMSSVFIMDFNSDTVWIHENNNAHRRDWRARRIEDLNFYLHIEP